MSPSDTIEKRGINRVQLYHVRDVLINKKIKIKIITIGPEFTRFWVLNICKKVRNQGRNAMLHEAAKSYGNITRPIVELFLNYCEDYCLKVKIAKNHGLVVKPLRSGNFMARWQIDLIDFRTLPDGEYCWIMNVQDHNTKFCWLLPLKAKSGVEVAKALFFLFGALNDTIYFMY